MSENLIGKCFILSCIIIPLTYEIKANFTTQSTEHDIEEMSTRETTTIGTSRHRLKEKSSGIVMDSFMLDRYLLGDSRLPPPDGNGPYCRRSAHCQRLNYTTCMGVKLPYSSTTLDLVDGVSTQDQIQEKLIQMLEGLRHVPKCWAVIQPFLCALYMPKCDDDMVDLPSQEMCKMTLGPCRILLMNNNWPSFPKCDDLTKFPHKCKNDVRELKFNTSGQCQPPLVQTDNSLAFYEGVEGCGVQCQSPLLTQDEHRQIHQLIAWGGSTCLLFNLFTLITFFIDWRSANKYPALVIFYINCCFLVACIGWLAQFTPGARQDIVCRKDGTLRMSEPSAGENLSCVVVFVLVYYFLMAAIVWFVILAYAWHISFQALGKIQEKMDKKGAYFHLVAWSLPLILTITTMALGEIDGNSVAGICFVGYVNQAIRAGLLLGPILAVLLVGGYFLSRCLITLVRLKISSQEIISERASAKIRETIVRMGLFSLLMFVFVVVTFMCHIYEFLHHREWKESFRKYIVCRITLSSGIGGSDMDMKQCKMESRPSLAMLQLHLLALFSAGIVMSSWVWTGSTFHTWKRFVRRVFNSKAEEPVRLKKHKLIAQAFAKRKTFNNAGRLSISFHSSHEDPVGLNFNMNSIASQDFSSTWAAALPKLMTRRGALIGVTTGSISSQRRNSIDSEISYSVRRVSVESRRHSLDSQVSVQIAEVTATRKTAATPLPSAGATRGRPMRNKRRRRDFARYRSSRVGPLFSRRGSTTSQESQLGAQILTALTIGNPNIPSLVPNLMKRRTGNAGLDGLKLTLPFNLPGQSLYISDEENNSDDKVPKSTEKFDIIVCGPANAVELQDGNTKAKEESKQQTSGVELRRSGHEAQGSRSSKRKRSMDQDEERKSKASAVGSYKAAIVSDCHASGGIGSRNRVIEVRECKSKNTDSEGHKSGSNRDLNKTDDVKLYQTEESEDDEDLAGLSESSSYCPELMCLAGSNSGTSVYTQHTLGGGKVRTIFISTPKQSNDIGIQVGAGREIGTQTSSSIDCTQMQELKRSPPTCSPHQYVSQGVQASPPVSLQATSHPKSRRLLDKSRSPCDRRPTGNTTTTTPGARALNYSYNMQRLVQELAEGSTHLCEPPSRPQRRRGSQSKGHVGSKSMGDSLEEHLQKTAQV